MTTITLSIHQTNSSSPSANLPGSEVGRGDDAFVWLGGAAPSFAIPPLTDPEQAYFWRSDWQAAERAADAELMRGEAPTFTDLDEGVRWLLSDE